MSLVDRLNRWVLGRLSTAPTPISVDRHGIAWDASGGRQSVPWERIARVEALNRGQGITRRPALAIGIAGGGVLELDEGTPGWDQLVDRMPAHLPLDVSPATWLAALASGERTSLTLFERGG